MHPFEERYTHLLVNSAHILQRTHEELAKDPNYDHLEMYTWEDIRALAIHFAIGQEKKEGR